MHHIIESGCIENLKAVEHLLLVKKTKEKNKSQSPYVNVKDTNGRNCLHLLVEKLTDLNHDEIFAMIKVILSYECNVNWSDNQGRTPLSILSDKISNVKNGIIIRNYFKTHADIDSSAHMLNLKTKDNVDVSFLMDLLLNGDINKFESKFPLLKKSEPTYKANCERFLKIAIESNYINIFDLIINSVKNVNILEVMDKKTPLIFWAYKQANLQIFSILLLHPQIDLFYDKQTLLHHFFNKISTCNCDKIKELDDYEFTNEMTPDEKRCFEFLINSPKCSREYLNVEDKIGYSAIYYSVKCGIDYMTKRLLDKGAYIGPVITNIRRSLLSDFLDSCITSNSKFHDDKEFELKVDYKFLIPPSKNNENECDHTNVEIHNSSIEQLNQPEQHEDHNNNVREMIPLKRLVENINTQRLIMHPVLASLVFLKWNKIRYLIHLNLVLTLLYIFSFVPFVIINEQRVATGHNAEMIYKPLYIASFFSLAMLIFREVFQLILSPKEYIRLRSNWVDMSLIFASLAILFDFWSRKHQLRMLHTIIILLATWEYFNLLGYLPLLSVSLHTKIFRKVFITFFKSLAFYSVMIIGFALAFYTLQGNKFARDLKDYGDGVKNITDDMVNIPSNKSRSDRYNNFYTVGYSIIKSFVMLTGELDASDIQLEGYTYSALFLLFLFIVTIVLYNLLNALAVSDTQEIKVDAKLIDLQQRVLTMHQNEKAIFDGFVGQCYCALGHYLKESISIFPQIQENEKISFRLKNNDAKCESKLKLSDDILNDMCTLLLKKREERAADRARKIKERAYEKLSCDIIKIKEVINIIQNRLNISSTQN